MANPPRGGDAKPPVHGCYLDSGVAGEEFDPRCSQPSYIDSRKLPLAAEAAEPSNEETLMNRRRLASAFCAALTALLVTATIAATPGPKPPSKVCLNDSGNCGDDTAPKTGVKWHPGNYMLTYTPGSPQSNLDTIRDEPLVIGAVRRYYWAQLETSAGVYDFSAIESDLKYLKSMPTPKRLVIQIYDRDYKSGTPVGVVPNYLLEDPRYGGKTDWYAEHGSRWYGVAPTNNEEEG